MKKTRTSKKIQKKTKSSASKSTSAKSKLTAKAKAKKRPAAKAKAVVKKTTPMAKAKPAPKNKVRRVAASVQMGSQSVEIVQVKPKARVARAGAGGGDFGGASVVADVDSESADELLEEGQTFEAGIVRGVQEADENIEQEVRTHEELQDDVPGEYDDKNRP
jgi:hypothetical protein